MNHGRVLATVLGFLTLVSVAWSDHTVVVSECDTAGWMFFEETPNGSGGFVTGPEIPPLGSGSVQLAVDDTGGMMVGTAAFNGLRLDEIDELVYSTFQNSAGSPILAIALQINVDYDVTDSSDAWQGRLVFEPYQNPSQGSVVNGAWQTWDARLGNWWMTGTPVVNDVAEPQLFPQSSPGSFDDILLAYPDAGVHATLGFVLFKAGGGWTGGFDGNVDAFSITIVGDTTTFDFESIEDSDCDGVADGDDLCPNSDLSPTVVVNGCDSGVTNHLFDDGCTISDLIQEIAANAKNRGHFVRGVSHLTNDLKELGIITGREKGAIMRCL